MAGNDIANPTAHSDLGAMLWVKKKGEDKFKYLVPIRTAPATGSAPAQIEVTEMDSPRKQYILDRQDTPAFEFDYNYTVAKFKACKEVFDGKTENEFLVTYGDKSGHTFKGTGATWKDAISAGAELKGKISVAVSEIEDVDDCTSLVDASTVPAGRVNPFAAA